MNENELNEIIDVVDIEPEQKIEIIPASNNEIISPSIEEGGESSIELSREAKEDFDYVRKNFKQIIETGKEALTSLSAVAEATDHPRAYEVLANLLKTIAESNKELMELHKQKKELERKDKNERGNTSNTTNNNLILTTNELLKLIKNNK